MKDVFTANAPAAIGPYTQAKIVGNMVYSSGQIAIVPATGALAEGGIEAQTKQVCENLKAVLAFCEKYNLKLTIAYSKTDVYNEGKIIYQSRAAKSEIVKGASLKITIAKPLDSSDNPDDEGKPAEEEQNP